jgi:hypothetical protein
MRSLILAQCKQGLSVSGKMHIKVLQRNFRNKGNPINISDEM